VLHTTSEALLTALVGDPSVDGFALARGQEPRIGRGPGARARQRLHAEKQGMCPPARLPQLGLDLQRVQVRLLPGVIVL